MKFLLRAVLRARRHFSFFLITVGTLIGLSVAGQLEMFSIGIIADTGTDFFALFAAKNERGKPDEYVCLEDVREQWRKIDGRGDGVITKDDAQSYMIEKRGNNPLKKVIYRIKKTFHFERNMKAFITLLLLVAATKACFLFFSRYSTQILSIRISRDLRQQYFDHLQHQPMSFFQKYNTGTLSSRVSGDANQIAASINSLMINYIQAPFTILSTLIACFWMSWQLSMVIFFGLPMVVVPVIFVTRKVKRITRQLQKNQERFTSVLIDFLAGIQTVKVFSMELFSFKKYQEQNVQMAKLESKTAKYDLLTRPILHMITTACIATVLIVGLYILEMRIAELIVFLGLLNLFYEPVKKFAEQNSNIQKGVVAAERMNEVLSLKPQITDLPGSTALKGFKNALEFESVCFRYADKWVLKDLSFTVKKGETVALVGETGVGKSTIAQLIPRLYEPQQGSIRIDGKEIDSYTQQSLREHIAFVPQKPFLFYDTVAANISYGKPFSLKEIVKAAKKAHAHGFIEDLPDKYETLLAETGKNFSGGQQQRLAIARALVKNAPILIFDEATSSLDAVSENKIKKAIKELHGEITQILIAHRLSTIEYADRIIYLKNGRKAAEGTKEELFETSLDFRRLWETHFRTEEREGAPLVDR
ncbi:MAG: ABC transporter ATP-binding protein [Chlamydiota bacterium]